MMKNMEEENYRFKEQYTTDTVRNTEKILDIINFKIEENQCIFDEKFDTVFRSKEIIEEKKNIIALKDKVSTLLESVEKQIRNEKQVKEDTALDIERLKQELSRMNKYIENLHQQLNEVHEKKKNSLILWHSSRYCRKRRLSKNVSFFNNQKQSSVPKRNPSYISYPGDGWAKDNWQPPSSGHFSEV